MEQAFVDFAVNHDIVRYVMGKALDLSYEISARVIEQAPDKIVIGKIHHDMGSQVNLLVSLDTIRTLFIPGIRRFADLAP